jgi:hypothetical protein
MNKSNIYKRYRDTHEFCQNFPNCAKLTGSELPLIPEKDWFHVYLMTNKKNALLFLLMFCIGMLPLQSLNAGNVDHMESMLLDCSNCDKDDGVAHGSCDNAQCILSTGFCGAQNITSFLSKSLRTPMPRQSLASSWLPVKSQYRSHLDFSIYRPPIA